MRAKFVRLADLEPIPDKICVVFDPADENHDWFVIAWWDEQHKIFVDKDDHPISATHYSYLTDPR